MSSGINITLDNFETEVLMSPIPVLLDFWASWCRPCRMLSSVLDELAEEYAGRIKVARVNVDEENGILNRHTVSSVPTLVVYKNGTILHQKNGAMPKSQVEDLFKDILCG